MRILVYPHDLGMGGSQLNAIELAGAVRDLGHDVVVYGRPGVLNAAIEQLGLDFVPSPVPGRRPSPSVARDLRHLVGQRQIDVLHGYEWPPILEARLGAVGTPAVAVGTVMSMAVAPFIPRGVPLVVGTEQIAAVERDSGRCDVTVLEPPVDTDRNAPGPADERAAFRSRHGVADGSVLVVTVTRLAAELKLEGLLTAVEAVPRLSDDVTLVVVGDGPAREQVAAAAEAVNAHAGRPRVVLTGQLDDPRPAYAAADVVLGMGGSALRALAFAKPLVVQGEHGFWRLLTPRTAGQFEWHGWYGVGAGAASGAAALAAELGPLLRDADRRAELGAFGRKLVVDRYSLRAAASRQVQHYQRARTSTGRRLAPGDLVAAGRFVRHTVDRQVRQRRGTVASEDFNSRPAGFERPADRKDPS